MKILQLCIRFPPAPGGAENHVFHVSKELISRGHDLKVFTSDLYTEVPFKRIDNPSPSYKGVEVKRFKAYSLLGEMHYVFVPSMLKALLKEKTDIVHTHSYGYYQTTAGVFAKKLRDTPLIITPHFHPPWSMWGGERRKRLRKIYDRIFGNSVIGAPDIVICHSKNEQELLTSFSLPEEKVRIIPAGIDFHRFKTIPSPDYFRERYQLTERIVLFVGRLASNKGLENLIDAMPTIISELNDITLVLVGEDEGLRKGLEERAEKLGITDKVIFTGYITDYELFKSAYSACDVFVLPSEYEAFGLVLLEAMSCEKPCVATNVGGVSEVIEEGKTGLLVEYGNPDQLAKAIIGLMGDEKKRKNMGRAGRERVKENFTWSKTVDLIERVYRELL